MSVAGDKAHYDLCIVDSEGNRRSRPIKVPRVTSILDVMPKNPGAMRWSGYKLGIEATQEFLKYGDWDFEAVENVIGAPIDELYDTLKKRKKITPNTNLSGSQVRGTDVHEIAENLFTHGIIPDITPEHMKGYVHALTAWWNLEGKPEAAEIIAVEEPLVCLDPLFAGTTDLIYRNPIVSSYHVVDFKTSKGIYDSHLLQGAAYAHAAKEMGLVGDNPDRITPLVVRLGQDGTFDEKVSHYTIDDFTAVYEFWERFKEGV